MQVHHDEGVANRIDPESCVAAREGISEALTGERIGQPLSRERPFISGADVVLLTEGNTDVRDIASAQTARRGRRPWHVRTFLAREPGDLMVGQQHCYMCWSGPHREGEEPKPMMNGHEKSDSAIVATKPTNKAERSAAEPVEPRAETKRNASEQSTYRTQSRIARVTGARARTASCKLCRQILEVGAVCLNWARTDLCGGRLATAVPTANMTFCGANVCF